MKTIKFRAWDKKEKRMLEVKSIALFNHPFHPNSIVDGDNDIRWFDSIELMQFTSLKDKNDKDIYEGDIFENQSGRGIIEWWPEHCCFGARKIGTGQMFIITSKGNTFATEVIGNIYENPELSKE